MIPKRGNLRNSSKLETSLFNSFSNPEEFCTSDFKFEFWCLDLMKFKPYVPYSLLRMAHLRESNSPKIPRGIGSRFLIPKEWKSAIPNSRNPEWVHAPLRHMSLDNHYNFFFINLRNSVRNISYKIIIILHFFLMHQSEETGYIILRVQHSLISIAPS